MRHVPKVYIELGCRKNTTLASVPRMYMGQFGQQNYYYLRIGFIDVPGHQKYVLDPETADSPLSIFPVHCSVLLLPTQTAFGSKLATFFHCLDFFVTIARTKVANSLSFFGSTTSGRHPTKSTVLVFIQLLGGGFAGYTMTITTANRSFCC